MNAEYAEDEFVDRALLAGAIAQIEANTNQNVARLEKLEAMVHRTPRQKKQMERLDAKLSGALDARSEKLDRKLCGLSLITPSLLEPGKLADRTRSAAKKCGATEPKTMMEATEFAAALDPWFNEIVNSCTAESPPPWAIALKHDPARATKSLRVLLMALVAFRGSHKAGLAQAQLGAIEDDDLIREVAKRKKVTVAEARRLYLHEMTGFQHNPSASARERLFQRARE